MWSRMPLLSSRRVHCSTHCLLHRHTTVPLAALPSYPYRCLNRNSSRLHPLLDRPRWTRWIGNYWPTASAPWPLFAHLVLPTLHQSLLVMDQLSRSPQWETRPFPVHFTLIMSLLLLISFKMFYLFIILLQTIGVPWSLTHLAFS
jgi:hypothetical protein